MHFGEVALGARVGGAECFDGFVRIEHLAEHFFAEGRKLFRILRQRGDRALCGFRHIVQNKQFIQQNGAFNRRFGFDDVAYAGFYLFLVDEIEHIVRARFRHRFAVVALVRRTVACGDFAHRLLG